MLTNSCPGDSTEITVGNLSPLGFTVGTTSSLMGRRTGYFILSAPKPESMSRYFSLQRLYLRSGPTGKTTQAS